MCLLCKISVDIISQRYCEFLAAISVERGGARGSHARWGLFPVCSGGPFLSPLLTRSRSRLVGVWSITILYEAADRERLLEALWLGETLGTPCSTIISERSD